MPLFIASPTDISQGDDAARRLETTNDVRFVSADGIIAVDEARWRVAQEYERRTWLEQGIHLTENRSEEHRAGFNAYADLPDDLGSVLELGCGVFTVVLDMLNAGKTARAITLVDPLADVYRQQHPHCAYKDGRLAGVDVSVIAQPVEEATFRAFDTVTMVNALSHCRNAQQVLDTALAALKYGGLLVFQETVHNFDPAQVYDAGHPLRPSQAYVDAFLAQFAEVYRGVDNYFVGRLGEAVAQAASAVRHAIPSDEPPVEAEPVETIDDGMADIETELAEGSDLDEIIHTPPADEPEMPPAPKPKRKRRGHA